MYKLLIADDEALARYAFHTLISKNFNNIEVVGEAESGRQAIELNRKLQPDIIIMDIKMPGINGIDASREILSEFSDRKILILTAYDNFNYVQQALDIGVKGYLVKPVKKEEVIEKINKVLQEISEDREKIKLKAESEIKDKISVIKPFIQKELVSAFITGTADVDEVKGYINFLQDKIEAGYFMLISPGQNDSRHINDPIRNTIYRDKVYDVAVKFLPKMKRCIFGNTVGNVIVVFFPVEKAELNNNLIKESLEIAQEIKRRIKIITRLDVAVGIGNCYSEIKNFHYSYEEANNALRKAMQSSDIIHYHCIQEEADNHLYEYPVQLESELLENIRLGNVEKAMDIANDMISRIFNNCCNPETAKEYVSQLVAMLKRTVYQIGIDINLFKNSGILTELSNLRDFEEIKIWCKNSVHSIIEQVGSLKQYKNTNLINQIHNCIKNPFCKDITLESVAEKVGISPQYLSKIFKDEFGTNFIDYIIEKRISYAKELLKHGNKNIKQISNMVGYEDANYFCRIFKKNTGLTPKQYRIQKR
ncbi:MAG TPA: response regulator [Clostridiaceae bacterium]|nr:response regulator [Clostridiaceae bacterium]